MSATGRHRNLDQVKADHIFQLSHMTYNAHRVGSDSKTEIDEPNRHRVVEDRDVLLSVEHGALGSYMVIDERTSTIADLSTIPDHSKVSASANELLETETRLTST